MIPKRIGRDDDSAGHYPSTDSAALTASALRAGAEIAFDGRPRHTHASDDQKISVYWRVFGGAILSMAALAGITLYNNISTNISELRAELARVNEARGELVKKDEFNSRSTSMWNRVQEVQAVQVSVTSLKEQVGALAERCASAGRETKEAGDALRTALAALREKLTAAEQQLKTADDDHRAFMQAQAAISALQEKATARDTNLRQADEERRALSKELQQLRERVAKVEGMQGGKPAAKSAGRDSSDE